MFFVSQIILAKCVKPRRVNLKTILKDATQVGVYKDTIKRKVMKRSITNLKKYP